MSESEELTHELQGAFKWAQVGFHARSSREQERGVLPCSNSARDLKIDPVDESEAFEISSFKKAATGLVGSALRLVGSEGALLAVVEDLIPGTMMQKKDALHCYSEQFGEVGETDDVSHVSAYRREKYQHVEESAAAHGQNTGERTGLHCPSPAGASILDEEEMREFLSKEKLPSFKDIAAVRRNEFS